SGHLSETQIHFRPGPFLDASVADVAHYSYDPPLGGTEADELSNGLLPRPQTSGHGFVDDDDFFRLRRVTGIEIPARAQGDAHRLQIAVVHHPRKSDGKGAGRITCAFHAGVPRAITSQRQGVGQTDGFYPGNGGDSFNEL